MCIVCIEMAKGKLTNAEAKRALKEVALDIKEKGHAEEVLEAIAEEEKKLTE